MSHLAPSELILNADGSVYHLHLRPEHLATTIITVGDQNRVAQVAKHFDAIEHRVAHREFVSCVGRIGTKRMLVISTGIGTDNIDIVLNELDALANINLATRQVKEQHRQLDFIRIGTSGALQADLPVDSFLVSRMALGLDGLMHYYEFDNGLAKLPQSFIEQLPVKPYLSEANAQLMDELASDWPQGITLTCSGFYAPQGRQLRAQVRHRAFIAACQQLHLDQWRCTNMEMETAGIYGLAQLLGHRAISFNALLANRATGAFSTQAAKTVEQLIEEVLARLVAQP